MKITVRSSFFAAPVAAGMPEAARDLSVVPRHQIIPHTALDDIARFIRVFDLMTTRDVWQGVTPANSSRSPSQPVAGTPGRWLPSGLIPHRHRRRAGLTSAFPVVPRESALPLIGSADHSDRQRPLE